MKATALAIGSIVLSGVLSGCVQRTITSDSAARCDGAGTCGETPYVCVNDYCIFEPDEPCGGATCSDGSYCMLNLETHCDECRLASACVPRWACTRLSTEECVGPSLTDEDAGRFDAD